MEHILIVGANSGIGYYIVKQLLEDGMRVSVLDINLDNTERLVVEYKDALLTVKADSTDEMFEQRG